MVKTSLSSARQTLATEFDIHNDGAIYVGRHAWIMDLLVSFIVALWLLGLAVLYRLNKLIENLKERLKTVRFDHTLTTARCYSNLRTACGA